MKHTTPLFALPLLAGLALVPAGLAESIYQGDARINTYVPSRAEAVNRAIEVEPTRLQVDVQLDKAGSNPLYQVNEPVSLRVTTNQDSYVYVFSVEANGQVHAVFPNVYSGTVQFVRAGQPQRFPAPGDPYRFVISPPFGQAYVMAVASEEPLTFEQKTWIESNIREPESLVSLNRRCSHVPNFVSNAILVESTPDQTWATDAAFYRVAD